MKDKHLNQTAYRLLLLLQWLWESPMSLDEINARFEQTPRIGRAFSQDNLGLHINTLKALGCRISRPSKTNQYRYHLTYFPFNSFLTTQDLKTLEESCEKAQNTLNYRDFIHFYQFLRKMFLYASNTNRHTLEHTLFNSLRGQPLEHLLPLVDTLESACQSRTTLSIRYQSPTQGLHNIDLRPHHLMHQQGMIYLVGYRPDRNTQSMLRLDRMESVTPTSPSHKGKQMKDSDSASHPVLLRILHCTPDQYEPFGHENSITPDPEDSSHLLVTLASDNDFLLKQKLLSCHYDFQILAPGAFAQQLCSTLEQMRKLYV